MKRIFRLRFASALLIGLISCGHLGTAAAADTTLPEPPSTSDKPASEKPAGDKSTSDKSTGDETIDKPNRDPAAKEDASPAKAEKKPDPIRIAGVFESIQPFEIKPDTERTKSWEIKKIVKHGATITRGQNVVVFDSKDIDETIQRSEVDLRLAKLSLDDAEFDFGQFQKTQELDRQAAKRDRDSAKQAHDNFVQVDRDRQVLTAQFSLKSSQASLENAQEELNQLQQMYLEDDLTEESEEIVLKRAKQAVESAQFRLDGTKISSDRSLSQSIPRAIETQEYALAKSELAYQKAIRNLNSERQRREIEIQRKRDDFRKQQDKHDELKQERKRVAITSPIDGVVVHGALTRGKVSDKPSLLETGTKVTGQQVVATIVNPDKLQIRVSLDEDKLDVAKVGQPCKITSDAYPGFKASGKVRSVSLVPYAGSKFDAVVQFKMPADAPAIMPTMTCHLDFEAKTKDTDKDE
ncbi:HlyD family secretion protein [Rubripirellula lacrimiformis]|uniref:HlyD family secretion protein n=1 Tax=Rubripirellula lacrimiformis TaxID=1930273 RepID=A0A517NIY5_9BACT|nr:HlyD family efflux transporter periplasmic adaptor subunit [Rubripirellula lacrimiformis]QDT07099.1 HlyD family secretion protein [Rubripirellula lacrimiformis]